MQESQVFEDVQSGVEPQYPSSHTTDRQRKPSGSADGTPDGEKGGGIVVDDVVEKIEAEQEGKRNSDARLPGLQHHTTSTWRGCFHQVSQLRHLRDGYGPTED